MSSAQVDALTSTSVLGWAGAGYARTVAVAPVVRRPLVAGARATFPGEVAVPMRVSVYRRGQTRRAGVLDQIREPRFQDVLSEPGSASIMFANDDPDLALIGDDALVLFELWGWAAFTMLPRELSRVTISPQEESGGLTTVTGAGTLAVLEEAVIYPSRGLAAWPIEEDRVFSWPSVDYDDSWWGPITVVAPTVADMAAFYLSLGAPSSANEWPDPTAAVIWGGPADRYGAPDGDVYFRQTFTAPERGNYRLYWLLDNWGTVYIDGQSVSSTTGKETFQDTVKVDLQLSAGTHTVAVVGTNWASPPYNPGALALCVYALDSTGNRTTLATHTDSTWRALPYPPEPPGMTPGEAMLHCIAEAQARNAVVELTTAFDARADSAGAPWPIVGDLATKVGYDLLTFFRELAGTYIDMAMAPASMVLYAWARGTRGEDSGVTLHRPSDPADPWTGNLGQLSHKRVF